MKYRTFVSLAVVLLVIAGCSGKVPLGGTVTFKDDGTPLPQGAILFQSETILAQGGIQPDGTYRVGTDKITDGLPLGTYQVCIVGTDMVEFVADRATVVDPSGVGLGGQREVRTPLIDPKYASAATSGLSFVVDGKTKKFDIQVDRAK